MNTTDEKKVLTAQICAAYWGAEVSANPYADNRAPIIGKMVGITTRLHVKYPKWQSIVDIEYSNCKLILRPLSEITDKDAVEVADIYLFKPEHRGKEKHMMSCQFEEGTFIIIHDDYPAVRVFMYELTAELVDFLRSRNYDCGHGDIVSLIDAGIAVKW
jgi:hypothetical protein